MNPLGWIRRNRVESQTLGKSYATMDGTVAVQAEQDASITPVWTWATPAGTLAARIVVYFDTVANIAYASYQGIGSSGGDVGIGEIQGINRNTVKYGYIQVKSTGLAVANLTNGSDLSNSAQRYEVQTQTSDTGNPTTVITLNAVPTSAHAAGFGARLYLQADGSFQGAIYGSFTGAGTGADLYVQAQHSVKFAQGTTPNITGSRGGNAALASLLTALAATGLITDSTT